MSHWYGTNRPLWTISRLQIGWKSSSLTLAPMDCNDAKRWWFFNGVYQLSWFRVSMVFSINLWINCMHTFLRNWGIYCAYIHKQSNWHNQFWCPTLLYVFVFYEFNGVDIICYLYIYIYILHGRIVLVWWEYLPKKNWIIRTKEPYRHYFRDFLFEMDSTVTCWVLSDVLPRCCFTQYTLQHHAACIFLKAWCEPTCRHHYHHHHRWCTAEALVSTAVAVANSTGVSTEESLHEFFGVEFRWV